MQLWRPEFQLDGINSNSWYMMWVLDPVYQQIAVEMLHPIDMLLSVMGPFHDTCHFIWHSVLVS